MNNPRFSKLAVALPLLLVACAPPELCPSATAEPTIATVASVAHAHNDYEHPHPLADARAAGFTSVEALVAFALALGAGRKAGGVADVREDARTTSRRCSRLAQGAHVRRRSARLGP